MNGIILKRTVRYYRTDILELQKFGEKLLGDLAPSDVGVDLIREWIVSLMDKGYAPNTVNRKLSSVRTYYKYLLKKGLVAADPLRRVTGPKKKETASCLSERSVKWIGCWMMSTLEKGLKRYRDRLIIEMFYTTGMRLSELIGLDDKDVDFSASLIKVTGKRNKQRLIPFDKELGRSMQEYVNVRNQALPVRSDAFFVRKEWRKAWPRYRSIYCETKPVKGSNCKKKKSACAEAYLCNGYAEQWC